jgi:hypothetical protein
MSVPWQTVAPLWRAAVREGFEGQDRRWKMISEHERLDDNLRALERRGPIVCLPLMRLPSEPVDKPTILHMKELLARTLTWMKEW